MLLYPYYMGMGIHVAISSLLFRGKVSIQNTGWVSQQPFQYFAELSKYMKSENHNLHDHIDTIGMLYVYHATNYGKIINEYAEEAEGRIEKLGMMISCTEESYLQLKKIKFDNEHLLELRSLLTSVEFYTIASIDFMFMAYEASLELGSTKEACEYISDRVKRAGSFENLLFDCLLHRITSILPVISSKNEKSKFEFSDIITDSKVTARILERAAHESNPAIYRELDNLDTRIDMVAYRLFDGALSCFHEKNDLATPKKLGCIFKEHYESLEKLRTKCKIDASEIILNSKGSQYVIESKIKNSLLAYRKEVADILSVKSRILTDAYQRTTEDPVIWSAFLAGIMSLQAGAPAFLPTSAAITAASKVGVSVLKSKREAQKKVANSPMSIFTHLK